MRLGTLTSDAVHLYADKWSEPFWAAAAEHRLAIPRCASCQTYRMPPSPRCPRCRSEDVNWESLPPSGTLFSYTIVEQSLLPEFDTSVPFAVGVAVLDHAPVRLIAHLVVDDSDDIRIDEPVVVDWLDLDTGAIPILRPA